MANEKRAIPWKTIGAIVVGCATVLGAPVVWLEYRLHVQSVKDEKLRQQQAVLNEQTKVAEERKREELARRAEFPVLRYLSSRWEDDYALLSILHDSKTRYARVSEATFHITDPAALEKIRRVYPQSRPQGIGTQNHVDNVLFRRGTWMGNEFSYTVELGVNIPPGPANDLRLAIIDPRLAGLQFKGSLDITYSVQDGFYHRLEIPVASLKVRRN